MPKLILFVALLALLGGAGCSGSNLGLNTAPLTEEEKQKIKEADKRVEDEERSGSGQATRPKGKRPAR